MNNINNKEAAEISGVAAGSALRGSNDPAAVSTAVLAYIGDAVYERLADMLTEEEASVARRGKNHKITSMPHNVDQKIYRKATGFEALIGFLEVSGADARLESIIAETFRIIENERIDIKRK